MHLIGSSLICQTVYNVSECKDLNFWVPQGSVLGPKIYRMFTKTISDIIAGHGLSHHSYADDTQLYIAIEHSANIHNKLLRMERCVADNRNWIRHAYMLTCLHAYMLRF